MQKFQLNSQEVSVTTTLALSRIIQMALLLHCRRYIVSGLSNLEIRSMVCLFFPFWSIKLAFLENFRVIRVQQDKQQHLLRQNKRTSLVAASTASSPPREIGRHPLSLVLAVPSPPGSSLPHAARGLQAGSPCLAPCTTTEITP